VNKADRKLGLSLKLSPQPKDEQVKQAAPKAQAAPKKQARKEARVEQPAQPKTKSLFQLELEKHTTRKSNKNVVVDENDDEGDEE
jgi:hypothetical protein